MAEPFDRRAIPEGFVFSDWRAPDGWRHRAWAWPAQGAARGTLIYQSGRAGFIEKDLEALGHWHAQGWDLAGFDWRGQGGSDRYPGLPAAGHLPSLDPLVDDLAAFVAEGRHGPPVLVGHSMGGHVVLRLLGERSVAVAAAVLVAPMLGLNSAPLAPPVAASLARAACRLGLDRRMAWRSPPDRLRQRALTSSRERFEDSAWWRARTPGLGIGQPTWGWLRAAYGSIAKVASPGLVERVDVPVLLLAARRDRLVSVAAIEAVAARLPNGRLRMFDEAAHEILREDDPVRLAALGAIDAFLAETVA